MVSLGSLTLRGMLITLEGIDGTGKTTVLDSLREQLSRWPDAVFTAEPTGGEAGQLVRKMLSRDQRTAEEKLELLFLFLADHAHHLDRTVIPALKRGAIVVSDRYSDSRAAYQGATLEGLVPNSLEWVQSLHRPWSAVPDLTLLLDLDPRLAVQRCQGRLDAASAGQEAFERMELLREVRANFSRLVGQQPHRFHVIDASKDPELVADEAWATVKDRLKRDRPGQ